ncbi:YadA-like family protein [Escherichia coli]|nr:YadA-like family protein [Escherichia coli]
MEKSRQFIAVVGGILWGVSSWAQSFEAVDFRGDGELSVIVGKGARATEKLSTATGGYSSAFGVQSTAIGAATRAYATASTAIGVGAGVEANASGGTSIGRVSTVSESNGVAVGMQAKATHRNSVALGTNSRTTREDEVYIGYESGPDETYKTRMLGGLSDGIYPSDAATVRQVGYVKGRVEQLARDTNVRIGMEAKKSRDYTDARTTVGVNSDGTLTRTEGTSKNIAVNDGLVALSGRTDRIDAAMGSINNHVMLNTRAVRNNTNAIASHSQQLQEHKARLNIQQRQIRENHEEMKRAAAQNAALAGLFQPYSVGKLNATAAMGGFRDKQAVAVGVGYRFNEKTAAKAGVATSNGDTSYNVGVNFEF